MIKMKFPSVFQSSVTDDENAVEFGGLKWKGLDVIKGRDVVRYPANYEDLAYFYPLVVRMVEVKLNRDLGDRIAITVPTDLAKNKDYTDLLKTRIAKYTGKLADVYPQGVYALLAGLKRGGLITNTLIIDGGFNTVNVAVVQAGLDGLDVLFMRTYTGEGIKSLLGLFYEKAKKKVLNLPSNEALLKEVFLKGQMSSGVTLYNLKEEKREAITVYMGVLVNRIKSELSSINAFYDQIMICGGLAYYVNLQGEGIRVVYGDEYSNAEGVFEHSRKPTIDFGFGDVKVVLPE